MKPSFNLVHKIAFLLVGIFLITVIACEPGRSTEIIVDPHTKFASTSTTWLRCHYLQGQKYALDTVMGQTQVWLDTLLQNAMNDGAAQPYDLFQHAGGGPGGSEWNTNNDLVLVWNVASSLPKPQVSNIRLNDIDLNPGMQLKTGLLIQDDKVGGYIVLPSQVWLSKLRPAIPEDSSWAFKPSPNFSQDALAACSVLKIEITLASPSTKSSYYFNLQEGFAVAFGE